MDALANMLSDPLDPKEARSSQITEECMLGNCIVSLPEDLLEDPDIFFSVVSESTWSEVLSDSQKQHLRQFLPRFPENEAAEQDRTISDLFNNRNFSFGNPLHLAQKLFRDGYFNPEVVKYRKLCAKSQRRRHLSSLQQYYHRLLKQILVSRKELLDFAAHNGLDFPPKRRSSTKTQAEMREPRVRKRLNRILKEVKTECEDSNASSDDDALWNLAPPSPSSPTPSVSLRVLPTLFTHDTKTMEKVELGEEDLRDMLQNHREKRKRQPDHPDLVTSDIQLGDILSRANVVRKGSMPLFELSVPKKKMRDEKKKKKLRTIKLEAEDLCDALVTSDVPSAPNVNLINSLPDTPSSPLTNIKEEIVEEYQSSPVLVDEIAVSFFSLLENILRAECLCTTSMLEEKVQVWQTSPASSLNAWFSSASCWSELVLQALQFLAGETKGKWRGFSPFVEFVEDSQQWRWIGSTEEMEKDLSALCQLWLDSKDFVVKMETEDMTEMTSPTQRLSTDYVVRPSTGDERQVFQVQEQQRYNQPHKAFTFRMHGFESVVGPVKGVFDKEMSLNKAREHTLLRSDRPPYVTILSLVRDAAARLPNGEGTRAEICELLKDSQFLASDVTSAQVNTVVSGALDRLHYEKDPCVKYDIGRKLWIYLHRNRSQEEFERIHQAQAAAAKARKALQQKPKPASKPVSPQQNKTTLTWNNSNPRLCFRSLAVKTEATKLQDVWTLDKMPTPIRCRQLLQRLLQIHQELLSHLYHRHPLLRQLGVKTQSGAGIPITATNLRIQGKDVLRLPPSSITTDAKGQTVLRITPDMMATLAKSPVATVKLTSDFLATATTGNKSISATLHVAPPHSSPSSGAGDAQTTKAAPITSTLLKAAGDAAIRLMPTLAVSADQKPRTFTTMASPDKTGTTIRIMPGLGVIPQKQGQTLTMSSTACTKPLTVSTCANVVSMAKGLTVAPTSPLTLGTATASVRQVPATVVTTTQSGKLPARITVPLSVLNQPLKSKSVVTTPIVKGSINTNISSLGRNIILTTMPAGTKLIAGNKPVSFVTAQQFQQLQQQGQATQVRIQTVQAQQLQQHIATSSPKPVSTVVVTTASSHKTAPEPPPAPPQ
uniref:Nuclear factor related to kappa-B-binding protein n=1 Tax=Gouania willdenowi TaxID=441366 RepID=A0A8C5F0M5_GOUWI